MSEQSGERRHFQRIASDKPAVLHSDNAEYPGTVLDMSLCGVLLELADDIPPADAASVQVRIMLDGEQQVIEMSGEIVHLAGRRIGVHCSGLDLNSAGRLRRMVELNLDDHRLLERDLAELIRAG